ncbi:AraC family ligand binding domain-containing protein [[Ruminococcus] torques]|nr:AraC family ligand binding domain-containing protein [[Ruminococcus] torques]
MSDSILSGATITSQPAGYTFPHHLHSTIEIYRIISGECLMDVQSETLHCTKGDFIMILPNIVHSFYLNKNLTVRLNTSTLIPTCFQILF